MTKHNQSLWIILVFIWGLVLWTGCVSVSTPEVSSTPAQEKEIVTSTPEKQGEDAQDSDQIVLPVKRQVAPSDIQAQVRWFDGGAGIGGPFDCQILSSKNSKGIEVLYRNELAYETSELREGEPLLLCGTGLPPTAQVKWTLKGDTVGRLTYQSDSDASGLAELAPDLRLQHGVYEIHAVSGSKILETKFEVLPAQNPKIWLSGELRAGNTLRIHYAGFEPRETVITVWYVMSSRDQYQATYLTSWETPVDDSGYASELVHIPSDMCIPYSILAVQGREVMNKRWEVRGGFGLDLPALAIREIEGTSGCTAERWANGQHLVDNSSRLLEQVNMGTINLGETRSGELASIYEAHNWEFNAQRGESYSIQVSFMHNDFPAERVSIIDPRGNLVHECGHVYYGCSGVSPDNEGVRYEPEVFGDFTIRLDMFNEGDGAYSISLKSSKDENDITQHKIIIDDLDEGLQLGGPSAGWRTAPFGYKGQTHWTYCTDEGVSNWSKWTPQLPASGDYEVFVFVPEHNAGTKQAQYRVFHNGVNDESVVRQADYANKWVSIGTYKFSADGEEYLYLDDNTGEARRLDITIGFDAVKFVYVP